MFPGAWRKNQDWGGATIGGVNIVISYYSIC
jgi:hypothetical protein